MMKRTLFLFVFIPVLAAALVATTTAGAEVLDVPLYRLSPVKMVEMKCVTDEYNVTIPVPDRWDVEKAAVNFGYVNSGALLRERSQIVIRFNGYPVAQVRLDPKINEGTKTVEIPVAIIEAGYNTLSFQVSQHYSNECEDPCSAELWTTLKLDEAVFHVEYSLKEVPLKLSTIADYLFDPKSFPHGEVNLVLEDYTADTVTIAGIVASGIARRFDYQRVDFSVSNEIVAGMDNVLVGRKGFVTGVIEDNGLAIDGIIGPYLKIMHLPTGDGAQDPTRPLIVISGLDQSHLTLAASTFAIMSFPYPDTDETLAVEFSLPDIALYSGRLVLTADKEYDFKTLNFDTRTLRGMNSTAGKITFRLPADFLIKQNQYVDLRLDFSYGAGMRKDSVLNIALNDKEIHAIHLGSTDGALIEGYRITIPTYLFLPGTNTIELQPILTPSESRICEFFQTKNLFFTIFGTSTMKFPPMPHLVDLPKIELFMLNGFPFTRWPDGHETLIHLTEANPELISAALNLIGFITLKNGYPFFSSTISFDMDGGWDGELIVIGPSGTLSKELMERAPLKLSKRSNVPYPVVRSWNEQPELAFSGQMNELMPGRGVMMEFQSPYQEGRTTLLFTGATTKDVLELTRAVMDPGVQGVSKGDLILVDLTDIKDPMEPDYKVSALRIGDKYFTGKAGNITTLDFYLQTYPYLYYVALAATVLLLSVTLTILLKRLRRRRVHGPDESGDKGG